MERISFKDLPEGMYEVMGNVEAYLTKSGFDPKFVALIKLRASQINSCAYCIDMHYKEGIHAGETPLRLISVSAWRETPYYTPKEQAALAFTEILTHMRSEERSDAIHEELLKHFSQKEISFLSLLIAQINSWNRITRSFGFTPGNYQVRERVSVN